MFACLKIIGKYFALLHYQSGFRRVLNCQTSRTADLIDACTDSCFFYNVFIFAFEINTEHKRFASKESVVFYASKTIKINIERIIAQ